MTKIYFERSGGFMGRTVSLELDLKDLPDDQAKVLEELLDEANFFELPENLTEKPVPDSFTYTITVNAGFMKKHSVHVGDASAPDDLRPLLEELSRRARQG